MRVLGVRVLIGLILGVFVASVAYAGAGAKAGDSDIVSSIQKRLMADWGVRTGLDVEAKGGIVKLSGAVENILAKERAVEIARSTIGVRAVIDMIHVDVDNREDTEIQKDVVSALENVPAVERPDIKVEVLDGFVVLSGTVDSFTERHLAWRAAKGVKGVIGVRNDIYVEDSPQRRDEEIKADIEGHFRDSVIINQSLVNVQVKDGNVKLAGSVGSLPEKTRVRERANRVLGVKSVDDSGVVIKAVQGDMRRASYEVAQSEEGVRKDVRDSLAYDPRVDPAQINVEAVIPKPVSVDVPKKANVTLTGTARNLAAKWAAEEDARNTFAVSMVINNLIAPDITASDSELLGNIVESLRADPELGNYRFKISVLNGSIRLSGKVDSQSSKKRAENIVSGVKGVARVQNNLEVE